MRHRSGSKRRLVYFDVLPGRYFSIDHWTRSVSVGFFLLQVVESKGGGGKSLIVRCPRGGQRKKWHCHAQLTAIHRSRSPCMDSVREVNSPMRIKTQRMRTL